MLRLTGYYMGDIPNYVLRGKPDDWEQFLEIIDSPMISYEDHRLTVPDEALRYPDWGYFTRLRIEVTEGKLNLARQGDTLLITGAIGPPLDYLICRILPTIPQVRRRQEPWHVHVCPLVGFNDQMDDQSAELRLDFII